MSILYLLHVFKSIQLLFLEIKEILNVLEILFRLKLFENMIAILEI